MSKFLPFLFAAVLLFTACEEEDYTPNNYTNWTQRNDAAFAEKLSEAKTAIEAARLQHGADWEEHCKWRVFRLYSYHPEEKFESSDTVCVQILEVGEGTESPLYTDSIKVNYIGRIIPTDLYPEGRVFDHSGRSSNEDQVFSPTFANPTKLLCSNTVAGFTTALMHMHIGDKWRIFIHPNLGYGKNATTGIPAHSMLNFTVQLKGFARAGENLE